MVDPAAAAALWLATWLIHSTLLYGGAALAERWVRAPSAREPIWRAAMLGALLTATVQVSGLVERVPLGRLLAAPARAPAAVPEPSASPATVPTLEVARERGLPARARAGTVTPPAAAPADAAPADRAARPAWLRWRDALADHWMKALLCTWLAGAALAVGRLLWLGRLARAELAGRVPARGALAAEFAALCAERAVRAPPLRVAPGLSGPVSLPNGEIAVPAWTAESLDPRRRRALLAHELAHQQRRDPQWQVFALGLQALLWPQPLHALGRRRLAALAELQADAWAARAVRDPRAVAECLAECAERLMHDRAAAFGAAMTDDSLLVQRVDRLLEGVPMRAPKTSWLVKGGVAAALAAAALLFPGCDVHSTYTLGSGVSTRVTVDDDGDTSIVVRRGGYALDLESEGAVTFEPDESDVATLSPGGRFRLEETHAGVEHVYTVTADPSGALTRSLQREAVDVPLDEQGRAWLAAALPRMFTESGFDARARVARLLAAGGPARVLEEVDRTGNDHAKAVYIGELLGSARLEADDVARALSSAARIESDFELRTALTRALETQSLDGPRSAQLLEAAEGLGSDFERAQLLVDAAGRLPDDAGARAAWLATAGGLDSDFELRRTLEAGLETNAGGASFAAEIVGLAARRMSSDFELRTLLAQASARSVDATLASACLEAASGIGSDFERCQVLKALAPHVARDPELSRRYRDVAAGMSSDFERGQALVALDEAGRD